MKNIYLALLAAGLFWPGTAAAAYEDEGLSEAAVSTETAKSSDDEDDQTVIQENDEDLAAFVTDYIRKDTQLKGAFFMEEKATKKILRLSLSSVNPKPVNGDSGVKKVTAVFKDAAGKKYTVLFHLQNGPWGGLDIFKLEIKPHAGKAAKAD
ncbi:MAG TPA: hypothetical protein DCS63_04140 [Elusimicrobia bacterium]|nr:hypothetical protein [Elusimicrobiota bacterium]